MQIGDGKLGMIAGPCAVESAERMNHIAEQIRQAGANLLRGGAYKPRTSPYSFQGLGEEGLKVLRDAGQAHDLPVVTEVTDPRLVETVAKYADILKWAQKHAELRVAHRSWQEWKARPFKKRHEHGRRLAHECGVYTFSGQPQCGAVRAGHQSYDRSTRNLLDLAAVAVVKRLSHLPVIVDPSHATGQPDLILTVPLQVLPWGRMESTLEATA